MQGDCSKQSQGPKSKPLEAHWTPQSYIGQLKDKHF